VRPRHQDRSGSLEPLSPIINQRREVDAMPRPQSRRDRRRRAAASQSRPQARATPANEAARATPGPDAPLAFVIMPFNLVGNLVFAQFLRPLAETAGYRVERADTTLNQRAIMQDIVRGIQASALIIADLTGRNANVYYELGLSHASARDRPVLLLSQSAGDIPFDLAAYRAVVYSIELRPEGAALSSLTSDLPALLAAIRAGEVAFSNPFADFGEAEPIADEAAPLAEGILDVQRRFVREDLPLASAATERIGDLTSRTTAQQEPIIARMNDDPEGVDPFDHRIAVGAELAAVWDAMANDLGGIVDGELVPAVLAVERDFAVWIRAFQLAPETDPTEFLASTVGMAASSAEYVATLSGTAEIIRTVSQWLTVLIAPGERLASLFDRIAATQSRLIGLPAQLRSALGLPDDEEPPAG
jgi:hypothetical protein